jgi:hypothetical protein
MRGRHLRIAIEMQAIASQALKELRQKMERRQPLDMSLDDAKTLMSAGLELERQALDHEREAMEKSPIKGEIVAKKPN